MNSKETIICVFVTFMFALSIKGQTNSTPIFDKKTFGIGAGLDYGGIGINSSIFPSDDFGFFGGIGYAMAGIGYNVGCKIRGVPESETNKWCFYISGMYGYNTAIAVSGGSNYNKLFYGATVGAGFDYRPLPYEKNSYWSFAIFFPIRNKEVDEYITNIENHGVKFNTPLLPVAFSIGYNFGK